MKKISAVLMIISLAAVLVPGGAMADEEECSCEPYEVTLYAGQDIEVGNVTVTSDAEEICVTYQLDDAALAEGWLIYETHLAIAHDPSGVPTNRNGNPVPGQFPYGDDELGGVESYKECIDIPEGWDWCDELTVAAHAVIMREECTLVAEAEFGPESVSASGQGWRKDGTDVLLSRSDPQAVLTWDTNKEETDFFSLGFEGWIQVEFECCIPNGEGNDILVVEDTWGSYPEETALVWASQDGELWVLLGEADNNTRDTTYSWQTVSEFDLGELDCAKYIEVVEATDPNDHNLTADGYDLNTVQALQDCYDCTTYDETAWGDGTRFVEPGNWATYFTYTPCEPNGEAP